MPALTLVNRSIVLYVVFVVQWFLFNQFAQDSWWGVVVLDKFAEYFVLPAGIIFLISLLGKKGLVITLAFIPVLISAFYYLSFFVPISSPDLLGNEQRFRIATLNIWNHNSDIKQVIGVIDNTQADVVALQEITEEQREDLVAGLRQQYPHYHISKAVYGGTTAVFSRHPLRNVREIDIQIDRPSIVADLNWDEDPITVISAHLNMVQNSWKLPSVY